MQRVALSAAVLGALGAGLAAQNSFTVPSKATLTEPGSTWNDRADQVFLFWGTTSATSQGSRVQYLYDASDIAVQQANVTALQFRYPRNNRVTTSVTYTTQITLSNGPNSSTTASSIFANNHGPNITQAFSGQINLPTASNSPTWPAPWQAPVPFSQPFPHLNGLGQSLVVDFETTASDQNRITTVEGYRLEGGNASFEYVDRDCFSSSGGISGGFGWSPTTLVPGGSLTLSISGAPANAPSYAINAINFSPFGVGAQFGPFTTPFSLSGAGLPANPGCDWAIGQIEFSVTGNYRTGTSSGSVSLPTPVPIPNNPVLAGTSFFTQCIGVDTLNGQPSLYSLTAIKHDIGTGIALPASHVRRTFDPASGSPTTGSVRRSEAASLNLIY